MAIVNKYNKLISTSNITINKCLEHGLHYGNHKKNWDTRMNSYIYGYRNNIHIIDLEQSLAILKKSLNIVTDVVSNNGTVLFFSSDKKFDNTIFSAATQAKQPCMVKKWVNGTLTNFKRLKPFFYKKYNNNGQVYGNKFFMEMDQIPSLIFLTTVRGNENIIKEANKLHIPIIAIVDTDSNPTNITYPIPGNDDSIESIYLYSRLMYNAIIKGYNLKYNS